MRAILERVVPEAQALAGQRRVDPAAGRVGRRRFRRRRRSTGSRTTGLCRDRARAPARRRFRASSGTTGTTTAPLSPSAYLAPISTRCTHARSAVSRTRRRGRTCSRDGSRSADVHERVGRRTTMSSTARACSTIAARSAGSRAVRRRARRDRRATSTRCCRRAVRVPEPREHHLDGARVSHEVKLSSADRVLFPDDGITKGDLFDYYDRGRRRDRPAPQRPPVHDEALARGPAGRLVLPEAGAEGHPGLDPDARSSARGRAAARASRGSSTSRSSTRARRCSGWCRCTAST